MFACNWLVNKAKLCSLVTGLYKAKLCSLATDSFYKTKLCYLQSQAVFVCTWLVSQSSFGYFTGYLYTFVHVIYNFNSSRVKRLCHGHFTGVCSMSPLTVPRYVQVSTLLRNLAILRNHTRILNEICSRAQQEFRILRKLRALRVFVLLIFTMFVKFVVLIMSPLWEIYLRSQRAKKEEYSSYICYFTKFAKIM